MVTAARGQTVDPVTASTYTAGTSINLFAAPGGSAGVDGWLVRLPADWTLNRAVVLRYGAEQVPAEVRRVDAAAGQYAVVLSSKQQGPHEVVLQVDAGQAAGTASWAITPFTYDPMGYRSVREDQGVTRDISVKAAFSYDDTASSSGNRALALEQGGPIFLRTDRLPNLQAGADFTIEFWIRTTGLEEVILSTWSGRKDESYLLEVVIDASGRLRYYFGQQGRHESLMTRAPVADGRWHHVAVTYRAERKTLVLLREGYPVDSLRNVRFPSATRSRLAIGGRTAPDEASTKQEGASSISYSGHLDELRFWSTARPASAIRSTARRVLSSEEWSDLVQLRFEEEPSPEFIAAPWPGSVRLVPSALSFNAPLRHLQAAVEDKVVRLDWEADNPTTEAFVIERSMEGATFEPVGRVRARATSTEPPDGNPHYEFSDTKVQGQVVYYRIRQQFEDGTERISGTIKIGLGASDQPGASLIGNFPNPFSATTTIAYEVRETQPLRLTVWDLSGQRIITLTDETHTPGRYEQPFYADNLPSGTYFVRLKTPKSMASHRMVLLK